jgi:hypothetical protein
MAKQQNPITRLEDLEVKEVSIVDRPANQRRFLTVKSEEGMATKGAEIVTDDQGNLITKDGANTPAPALTVPVTGPTATLPVEKAEPPGIEEIFKAAGHNLAVLEKRLSIAPELRTEVFRSLGDAMGRLNAVMASADMAQTDRGDEPSTLTPVLATELLEVSKVIGKTAKMLSGAVKKSDGGNDPELFAAAVEKLTTELDRIEKAGAKMSKGRLEQFEKALILLGKLLDELKGAEPGTISAPKGAAPAPIQKDDGEVFEGFFEKLTKKIEGLTEQIAKSDGRIASLEKRRGNSNTIPVEKSHRAPAAEDVHWPMDMNDEKTRETVDKATNFFDN